MTYSDEVTKYHEKLADTFVPHKGMELTNKEIKKILLKRYPKIKDKESWILPSDHCINHTNKGACECSMKNIAIFKRIGRGKYLVL